MPNDMFHKINILGLITTMLLSVNNLKGQEGERNRENECPLENIDIHISQESLFPGDLLWFKIYCTSPLFPSEELSRLAFIELVSNENSSVVRKKILLQHGEANGEFQIPADLPTGLYYLIAYTNWMKNFGEASFFRKAIAIINPGKPYGNISDVPGPAAKQEPAEKAVPVAGTFRIITPGSVYSRREKVKLRIETGELTGRFISGSISISVNHKEPLVLPGTGLKAEPASISIPGNIKYLPDYKGIRLSGKLTDSTGHLIRRGHVLASFPGPGTSVSSSIISDEGDFNFILKPEEGQKEIILTVPSSDTKLNLEESFWNGFRNPPANMSLSFGQDEIAYLKEKFSSYQLQSRFKKEYLTKTNTFTGSVDSIIFYSRPYQVIEFKNFVALDSLREYFYELVPSVKFTMHKGEYDITVIDPVTMMFLDDKPGVFLDGVLYDNYSAIAGIPAADIDRISVLPHTYYYKDFTFGGIIDIHTKNADFRAVKPTPRMIRFIYTLADVSEWEFSSPDYSQTGTYDRTPDFRYLLYWKPDVKVGKSGSTDIEFYTGDITGTYVIKVEGMTSDGEILRTENEIYVGN